MSLEWMKWPYILVIESVLDLDNHSGFASSQPYNQETMEKLSMRYDEMMQTNFGGTELLAPLKFIFEQMETSVIRPFLTNIYFDGSVSNMNSGISEVRKNCHSS